MATCYSYGMVSVSIWSMMLKLEDLLFAIDTMCISYSQANVSPRTMDMGWELWEVKKRT